MRKTALAKTRFEKFGSKSRLRSDGSVMVLPMKRAAQIVQDFLDVPRQVLEDDLAKPSA